MPIDLTQPAAGSTLSSAVIRANFAAAATDINTLTTNLSTLSSQTSSLNAALAAKLNVASPVFTGDMNNSDGHGFLAGTGSAGGYFVAEGDGATLDKKPAFDWINYGANANEGSWSAWADVGSLHLSTVNDAFSVANDFMTVGRVGVVPTLALTFGTDAQGTYPMAYQLNVTDHFGGANVDGIKIGAGGKTWGYLVNTQKANGWNGPQLYIHNFPFASPNGINAPIRFDNTTSTGNNRAISINTVDTSTTGSLNVTSLEITQNSPPDRGGDTSALYINQSGGGNGISVYKLSSTFPNNGFALEARTDGTATAIWGSVLNGDAFHVEVTGPSGNGVNIYPKLVADGGTATLSNRAIKIRDFANTVEKFYVLMDGTVLSSSTGTFNGGVTVGTTTLLTTNVALSNGAAAATATMTNAPTAGNPTKWIAINDNGTTRRIPAW